MSTGFGPVHRATKIRGGHRSAGPVEHRLAGIADPAQARDVLQSGQQSADRPDRRLDTADNPVPDPGDHICDAAEEVADRPEPGLHRLERWRDHRVPGAGNHIPDPGEGGLDRCVVEPHRDVSGRGECGLDQVEVLDDLDHGADDHPDRAETEDQDVPILCCEVDGRGDRVHDPPECGDQAVQDRFDQPPRRRGGGLNPGPRTLDDVAEGFGVPVREYHPGDQGGQRPDDQADR
ncbi:hypothetical protein, partial [Rhodococcus jostii]|uniref:hypothetical protein n=1 Tax=Rhodococcus jostii TaxID=132919 RepID=UPI00364CA52C